MIGLTHSKRHSDLLAAIENQGGKLIENWISPCDDTIQLVLVYRSHDKATPYVTWRYKNGEFFWGHYHDSPDSAKADFEERKAIQPF